jgi:hypothetical protein
MPKIRSLTTDTLDGLAEKIRRRVFTFDADRVHVVLDGEGEELTPAEQAAELGRARRKVHAEIRIV